MRTADWVTDRLRFFSGDFKFNIGDALKDKGDDSQNAGVSGTPNGDYR